MLQTAVLRILIDLIKADSIIESNEMEIFNSILSEYRINNAHLQKAASITLSQAIEVLQSSEIYQQDRNGLLKHLNDIALVDGSCIKDEALILTAMSYCLSKESKDRSEIISVNIPNIDIVKGQILYIESENNESYHKEITLNYRQLVAEFKCAGLNLLYLPKITEHISNTNPILFTNVCHFLAPDLNEEELNEMITYIKNVTTVQFCKDLLFGKLFMSSVVNSKPGLLLHIGASQIEGKKYDNFLRFTFDDSVSIKDQMLSFIDTYSKILSYDALVIPKDDESSGHFHYDGFYKFLYDLYLVKNKADSSILIENIRTGIYFPQINKDFELCVSRREKALYVMIILESRSGGILFAPSDNEEETEKRTKLIKNKFRYLYTIMGGDYDNVPDIMNSQIRNPSIAHINTFFKNSESIFIDSTKYQIKKTKKDGYSFYHVDFDYEHIYARVSIDMEPINIFDSEMYSKYIHLSSK